MIYTDGTIAIKAGSPIVTGTGTQWKKNIHGVAPGQLISIENGAAPVSMMIRAVNSDTELVLSFNAPVTLSGAKYSIATTVPDTISDAARTMSANQGYIVYFLQAMQQWMTDTGQVEIELPNGQKVTLDSIKALNEAIKSINDKVDSIKIPDATTEQKGIVQLSATIGRSTEAVPHEKAVSDELEKYTSIKELNAMIFHDSELTQVLSPSGTRGFYIKNNGAIGANRGDSPNWGVDEKGTLSITHVKIKSPTNYARLDLEKADGYMAQLETAPESETALLYLMHRSPDGVLRRTISFPKASGNVAVIGANTEFDGNGFLKRSSPIILINHDGHYKTNDESEGAEVRRTGTGQYHITGILGYNSDGAWGVNGGISVPKDNNGLELVYVDDRVQSDGSLIIETCHRQHAHLPERFQNWRLKDITQEGERIFYQDGEPCDLPESTRLDVRVEMPQGSVWNVKQRELAEQMEREQAEREAQEAAEQTGDSDQ
ncbi:hypothetical protein ACO33K_003583 [Morganella morganii]